MKHEGAPGTQGERAAPTPPVAAFQAGSGAQIKRPWGRRESLIRTQFGEGKPRIFFALIWRGFAG